MPALLYLLFYFITVWTLWFVEFCLLTILRVYHYHQKVYDIKQKMDGSAQQMQMCPLQWIPALPHKLRKDTAGKASSDPGCSDSDPSVFPQVRTYLLTESDGRVMLLCTILVAAAYMGTGYLFAHMPNKIYSENSQINLQINALEKRLYTIFLLSPTFAIPAPISGSSGILHPATGLAELEWASTFSSN